MSIVKNVSQAPIDVGGRLVPPGRLAVDVDLAAPAIAVHLQTGALLDTSPKPDPARTRQRKPAAGAAGQTTTDQESSS